MSKKGESQIESKTHRLHTEEYNRAIKICRKIFDSLNMSQYVRDAIKEKNNRETKRLNK